MSPHFVKGAHVHYPESDGKPMAETDIHRDLMLEAIEAIREHFRDEPNFYVSGNLFVYYQEGDPEKVVAPDFFAVRGVPRGPRRIYKVWEEGKAPEVVLELTSPTTHLEDLGNKRAIYEEIGVKEYFICDPLVKARQPNLRGFRLKEGVLQPIPESRREQGLQVFTSEVLGLELHGSGSTLRWVNPRTGKPLPTRQEIRQRAEEEQKRADAAEAEIARLRAELERLAERSSRATTPSPPPASPPPT